MDRNGGLRRPGLVTAYTPRALRYTIPIIPHWHVPKRVHYVFNNPPPPQRRQAGLDGRVRHRGLETVSPSVYFFIIYSIK
jgi:hypothetical protein